MKPTAEATSIARRIQDELDAPVAAGLHSLAASNLADAPPDEDAFVCGDDEVAKRLALDLASQLVSGRAVDCGPLASACSRGHDGRDREREQALQGARGPSPHGPEVKELRGLPARGHPGGRGGRRPRRAARRRRRPRRGPRGRRRRRRRAEGGLEGRGTAGRSRGDRAVGTRARARRRPRPAPRRAGPARSVRVVRARPLVIAETRTASSAPRPASTPRTPGERGRSCLPRSTRMPRRAAPRRPRRASRPRCRRDRERPSAVLSARTTDVALGVAGLTPLLDLRGVRDAAGYELHATQIAVADELAGAAELVLGKTRGIPPPWCAASTSAARAAAETSSCRPSATSSARGRPRRAGRVAPRSRANLKPCPLQGEPTTTRPRRSSRNSSFARVV